MSERAARFNAGKPQLHYSLTFPEARNGEARVSMYGSRKYDLYNYTKGAPISESIDCAMRHIQKWFNGEDRDTDPNCPDCQKRDNEDPNHLCKVHSGCNHLDHAVWNISRACDDAHRHPEWDDRPHVVLERARAGGLVK